jgi:DNA polymerase I
MQMVTKSDLTQRIRELSKDTTNLEPSLLVSATYDGERKAAILKFYHPPSQKIYLWYDNTGHKPYCYTKLMREEMPSLNDRRDIRGIERIKKYDLLNDREIELTKIVAEDPLAIGGTTTEKSIRNLFEVWEADIKYHENYLYDNGLIVGTYYSISDGKLSHHSYKVTEQVELALKSLVWDKITESISGDGDNESRKYITEWAKLLNQPIPEMKRAALDIEVVSEEERIPDAKNAENEIIAVSFVGSDNLHEAFVLKREGVELGENEMEDHVKVNIFDNERELLRAVFDRILDYPFVITFNGDNFDMPYLYYRAQKPEIGISREEIPIVMQRDAATLKHGVHIDLYRTFSNRSMQIYAFGHKYSEFTLNAVSEALIGESKIEFDGGIGELPLYQLARYCHNDSRLTFKLTNFSDDLLMKLLVVVSRVGRMPIDDISRLGVSQWIRSMLYFEHRRQNVLIPRREELDLKSQASTTAIIKDKKYRGGLVVEPKTGVHFNVAVLDFASLYPSIIKVDNLSYETVRCVHDECKSNAIPETEHWVCKKRRGMESLLIGSLRDLRVNYYKYLAKEKSLSKQEKDLYNIISQALKVILNASYGVMGAEIFPLYCLPVAEATASIGRYTITKTIEKCTQLGIQVVYGDTDSLFLKGPSTAQIEAIAQWAKQELGVDLDLDKQYRYVAFSERKKNYLGVMTDGSVDLKGLTGKKSHTPPFIRGAFYAIVDILSKVNTESDFEEAKEMIIKIVKDNATKLKSREIPLTELAFNVMVSKSPREYKKTIPQHIRAAELLEKAGKREVKAGDIISYVKTKPPAGGVKPVELARSDDIDTDKYLEYMESTFDQILSPMGYDFRAILGEKKLDDYFFRI